MRVDPQTDSVTGTVISVSRPGVRAGSVDANLDDLRRLGAYLTTIELASDRAADTTRSIEWSLPFSADVLAPVTAAACAGRAFVLADELDRAGLRARVLSARMMLSAEAYDLAESTSAALMQSSVAAYSLVVTGVRAVAYEVMDRPMPPDTTAGVVGDVISSIDAALPGSYENAVGGIDTAMATALGRPWRTTTSIVAGPGSAGAPPAARTIGESMGRVTALYTNGEKAAHIQVQRVVDPATGRGHWVAMLPGTATFTLNAATPLDGSGNIAAAAGKVSDGERAVRDALNDAMAKEGVLGKGEPIMLVGHSQGGMVMTNLARRTADGLNITHVTTYGSPVGASAVPKGVRALNIENTSDLVPRIDGRATGDGDPGRVRLVIDDPTSTITADGGSSVIEAHSHEKYRWDYEAVMAQERDQRPASSAAVEYENSAMPFFEGEARTYSYDATREPSAEAQAHAVKPAIQCRPDKPAASASYGHGPADQYRVTSP